MKRFIITAFIALMCLPATLAQKNIVWDSPTTEFGTNYGDGFFNTCIDVTRVELKETETTVAVTLQQRSDIPDFRFQFTKGTYLLANGVRYPVVSADNIEFDKWSLTKADGKLDMVFHFEPLPLDTKVLDFIEGDGERAFQVKGIRPVEERHNMLFPSYWRNDETGEWEIAFYDNCAIYDCKFWDLKADGNVFTLTNNGKSIKVKVGKNKKGKRTITIDGKKIACSMITERFVPYYPTKDTRADFVDTNYKTDTATVVGWIKDMPEEFREIKTFDFAFSDFFKSEQIEHNAELDSLGRFSIKIPLINSTEFFCDWSRCFMRTLLEPGKTYFLLYDFKEGRRMWMGDDVRLQNELFRHPLDWNSICMEKEGDDFDVFIASADSLIKAQHAYIDDLCTKHPTLSTRFGLFRKDNTTWMQAGDIGQARFRAKEFQLPDNARQYAHDKFWAKMPKPYTLHREIRSFLSDYLADAMRDLPKISFKMFDHVDEIVESQEDLDMINGFKAQTEEILKKMEAAKDDEEKERIADEFNKSHADIIAKLNKIFSSPRTQEVMDSHLTLPRWKNELNALDSIGADNIIKSAWITKQAYQQLDYKRKPLPASVMDSLRAWIDYPEVLAGIEKKNEYYTALSNREFDKLILNMGEDVQGMTEGEEILKKLLEPYRGKIVLIDIWGTWCGPCKEALSHSEEEYARMAKYDMQFVYMANNSPMDTWENVIKEYNVTGPNVTHFNLDGEQQDAIERYLKVTGFPTFKLVDKQGNILDIKVDARDLDSLEELVKALAEQ